MYNYVPFNAQVCLLKQHDLNARFLEDKVSTQLLEENGTHILQKPENKVLWQR